MCRMLTAKLPRIPALRRCTVSPWWPPLFPAWASKRPANLRFNSSWLVQQPHQEPQTSGTKRHHFGSSSETTLSEYLRHAHSFPPSPFQQFGSFVFFSPICSAFSPLRASINNNTIATPPLPPFFFPLLLFLLPPPPPSCLLLLPKQIRRIVRLGFWAS